MLAYFEFSDVFLREYNSNFLLGNNFLCFGIYTK